MTTTAKPEELGKLKWQAFDEILLRDRVHGFDIALYRGPGWRRAEPKRLLVDVADATDTGTQYRVKTALRVSAREPGWFV